MRISSPLLCLRTIIRTIINQKRGLKPATTYLNVTVRYVVAGFSPRSSSRLKTEAGVDDKPSRSARRRDTSECVHAVDIRRWSSEVRVVQHIDRVDAEFEFLGFVDPEALDEIGVKTQAPRTFQCGQSERAHFSRLRIYQDD